MNKSSSAAVLISCLLFVAPAQGQERDSQESNVFVTFMLVPEDVRAAGNLTPENLLPTGRVLLYRQGEYAPSLVVEVNERRRIPLGVWNWIAESDGYVSVASGVINNRQPISEPLDKRLVWDVVPACEVQLSDDPRWASIDRVDILSIDRGAVFPVLPGERRSLWVPIGRNLAYAVTEGRLAGIRLLDPCAQIDQIALDPPGPPPPELQDLMISFTVPTTVQVDRREVRVVARSSGADPSPVVASAGTWSGNRGTFFFLGLPARPLEIAVSHPALQEVTLPVEPSGGLAREMPTLQMTEVGSFMIPALGKREAPGL